MAKEPTYFSERKEFLARMITEETKIEWRKEMSISKRIFSKWDIDFLGKVPQPFSMNSLAWFLTEKGVEYLTTEHNKSKFRPKEEVSTISKDKIGEDININKKLTIREILNGK